MTRGGEVVVARAWAVRTRSLEPALWQELSVVHRETSAADPRLEAVRGFAELVLVGSPSCRS